ncbi:efflux transporter outer membrane subunit [Novosphingobium rosa]|uniref:efflux transporter outer membrane subunit n=1 Tax=Novosphingobium rosa TaxID=76978 RepID=UPI00082FC324|nr:efflux transporter outer membrane subunit [Novosphingobium rosa]
MRRLTIFPLLALAGCSMNPHLERPALPVAPAYPQTRATDAPKAEDLGWQAMLGDPQLRALIALALDDNRDLRIAVMEAQAARAQFRVTDAARLPQLSAQGSYTRQRIPSSVAGAGVGLSDGVGASGFEYGQWNGQVALSAFELDLFGRLKSQSQAAFERYLATAEGARASRITVITTVANAWLARQLAAEQEELTRSTLADWHQSLDLTRRLRDAGQSSGLEVAQAEGLVRQAEADLQQREREIAQANNALTLAVGHSLPGDPPAPARLMQQPIVTRLDAGLPSSLLERRPDIVQAEHTLRAANADVGAARAAFFPRLTLTGAFGGSSLALDTLFTGASRNWSFAPALTVPIFQGGQLRGSLRLADVRKSQAVAAYEKAIQSAFRDVADGLAAQATYGAQMAAQLQSVSTADRRAELSRLRYTAGVDSRLELLDAQRSAYSAQQTLLALRKDQLAAAIALYGALGGGLK